MNVYVCSQEMSEKIKILFTAMAEIGAGTSNAFVNTPKDAMDMLPDAESLVILCTADGSLYAMGKALRKSMRRQWEVDNSPYKSSKTPEWYKCRLFSELYGKLEPKWPGVEIVIDTLRCMINYENEEQTFSLLVDSLIEEMSFDDLEEASADDV